MRSFFIVVFLVIVCATNAAAGSAADADLNAAYMAGDYALVARILRPLAEQGDAKAQFELGSMYAKGKGVPVDTQEAVKWYHKAAEQGHVWAQYSLAQIYVDGRGVPRNAQEGMKWIRKAAEQGFPLAQFSLGWLYKNGSEVPKDLVRAYVWFTIAAAPGNGDTTKAAIKYRDDVASQMTATQLEKAQEMARHCKESKLKECD
jgi:hypothetical protein